jgi:hypothetical protein
LETYLAVERGDFEAAGEKGVVTAIVTAVTVVGVLQGLGSLGGKPASGSGTASGIGAAETGIASARTGAAARAIEIQSVLNPRTQRSVTTAVTETREGVRVVTSSEGALRPAQRAALQPGEIAGIGKRGVHAEINGVNAARDAGLTPTGVAPSRPACSACTKTLHEMQIPIISP